MKATPPQPTPDPALDGVEQSLAEDNAQAGIAENASACNAEFAEAAEKAASNSGFDKDEISPEAKSTSKASDPSTPSTETIAAMVGGRSNLKKILIGAGVALFAAIAIFLFSTHTICFHNWSDATCDKPKKCSICKRTDGEPLGHDYSDPTCTEPAECDRCGKTTGKANGHTITEWIVDAEATCAAEGLKHGACDECRAAVEETIGKLTAHTVSNWSVSQKPTCSDEGSQSGTCEVCGGNVTESISKTDHIAGSWQTTGTPYISNGNILYAEETVICTACGIKIDSRTSETTLSTEQKNALNRAWDYLDYTAFSHNGLVDQLEFEGYSSSAAKFAADNCGANWNEQAAKKARSYLDYTSFSRSGLISQLKFEGFTQSQAEYGVEAVGY